METGVAPPKFITGTEPEAGAITALRVFRLFRIFKLARKWKTMHTLLTNIVKCIGGVANVGFLLMLFMYIFSLLGMQIFAHRLKFDEYGYVIEIGEPGWAEAESPRANFDDLLWY